MELKEKAAYLKGLADGLDYDRTTPEGKILAAVIDLLGEVTAEIGKNKEDIVDLSEYVDELDRDLGDVEEYLFGDDDDFDDEEDDFDDDDEILDEYDAPDVSDYEDYDYDEDEDEDDENLLDDGFYYESGDEDR